MGQNFPWFIDSVLCVGLILHGLFGSKPNVNYVSFSLPGFRSNGWELELSHMYLIAGYYSFMISMALAPYKAFYPLAWIGVVSFVCRIIERKRWDPSSRKNRKHSHKHWNTFDGFVLYRFYYLFIHFWCTSGVMSEFEDVVFFFSGIFCSQLILDYSFFGTNLLGNCCRS